jgi:hypothetical protein
LPLFLKYAQRQLRLLLKYAQRQLRLLLKYAQRQLRLLLKYAQRQLSLLLKWPLQLPLAVAVEVEVAVQIPVERAVAAVPVAYMVRCFLYNPEGALFSPPPARVPDDTGTPRSGARSSGRLFLVTFFGEAKKVTRPPGRIPGLSPRQCNRIASPGKARAALSSLKFFA